MSLIIKENSIIHTRANYNYFLGSSDWCYSNEDKRLVRKSLLKKEAYQEQERFSKINSKDSENANKIDVSDEQIQGLLDTRRKADNEAELQKTVLKKKEKTLYKLNKQKVRDKCFAMFNLERSKKFMAFYSISFPCGYPQNYAVKALNTALTRCRKMLGLKTYLHVTEFQKNGTPHFHLVTNNYMYIRYVNHFFKKAIENQIKKYNLNVDFDPDKYNGVDVKRCDNNRKKLASYLTKYIAKNNDEFEILPYHSSRDVSELITSICLTKYSSDYEKILEQLKHVKTLVLDLEFCTIEYVNQKQDNGKWFTPPEKWYSALKWANEAIYANHHSEIQWNTLQF